MWEYVIRPHYYSRHALNSHGLPLFQLFPYSGGKAAGFQNVNDKLRVRWILRFIYAVDDFAFLKIDSDVACR